MKRASLLILAVCVLAAASWSTEDIPSRINRVERGLLPSILVKNGPVFSIGERMEHYNVPGVCIAVINNFEIEWAKGYGVTDVETNEPVTENTLFQAASISKPVTGTVALYLAERGVLDLDEDVNEKLVKWKVPENEFTRDEKVTLRRLLTHTAGLTVSGFPGYGEGEPVPTILQVLDGADPSNTPPIRVDMTPGSGYRYSGGGYTVLQLLIEDVTGRLLPDLAHELIFEKLGMEHSSFRKPLPESFAPLASTAHRQDGTPFRGHWYLSAGSACCGLWTTPADLAAYAIELQKSLRGESNKILSEDMTRQMLTPIAAGRVGLGMFLDDRDGAVYFTHSGGNDGFKCTLIASRDEGYGAAVMTNSDSGIRLIPEIMRSIAREYGWKNYLGEEYESFAALVESCRKRMVENPDDPEFSEGSLNGLGYELLGMEAFEQAIAIFTLNVERNPESANCYDSLAESYWKIGDTENAIAHYRKALEILERYPEANARYGNLRESIPRALDQLEGGQK